MRPGTAKSLLGMMAEAPGYRHQHWIFGLNRQVHRHKLTIHISDCGQCNAGKGNLDGRDRLFGKWYGPFTSVAEVFAGMHHARHITEVHECATSDSASPGSIRDEERAMSRLDDDGANSSAVLPDQAD